MVYTATCLRDHLYLFVPSQLNFLFSWQNYISKFVWFQMTFSPRLYFCVQRIILGDFGQCDYSPGVSPVGGERTHVQGEDRQGYGSAVSSDKSVFAVVEALWSKSWFSCFSSTFLFFPTGVIETLHQAAYKNGLSNSLYCPDYMDDRISPEQVAAKKR